jgi:tRNA nucleotidyltransferase (CCA-adding enzyme)
MTSLLLRATVAAAARDALTLDAWTWAELRTAVVDGEIERLDPVQRWQWLAAGLMAPHPGNYLRVLQRCGGLARLLPEVAALFGVPQLSDAAVPIDVGMHQIRFVEETAAAGAPVAVRFAALMHKIGKGGTPREIWPSHYKHELRAHALLDQLPERIAVPAAPMQLAHLVVDECERVHRASDRRAGAISLLLTRLGVERDRERFEQLLSVCTCDYAAYEGHRAAEYPKGPRLRRALEAYLRVPVQGLSEEAASDARAQAVAQALDSFMQA